MKQEFIQVVLLIPGAPAYKTTIQNDYKKLKELLNMGNDSEYKGGLEHVSDSFTIPTDKDVYLDIYLNEEGKLLNLQPNRLLFLDNNRYFRQDALFGVGICVGRSDEEGFDTSLSDEMADLIIQEFNQKSRYAASDLDPEDFLSVDVVFFER